MTTFHRARSWLLALGLVGAFGAACAAPPAVFPQPAQPTAEFTVTEQKPDDRIVLTQAGGALTIDVWSESGIGSAVINLDAGEMPQPVIMRFHLAGLEQMTFSFDATVLTLSVASHGDGQVLRSATENEQPVEVTRRGPYWMDVERVDESDAPGGGYYEVTAPQAFYDSGATMFFVSWIDFFR